MKKAVLFLFLITLFITKIVAQEPKNNDELFEKTLNYESGKIVLPEGDGTLNVPKGFKFLNAEQLRES